MFTLLTVKLFPIETTGYKVIGVGAIGRGEAPKSATKLPIRWRSVQEYAHELSLLSWHCRLSEFVGRDAEIVELENWASNSTAISVKFVCGAGGTGKSRLAAEFAEHLAQNKWSAGFVDLRKSQAFPMSEHGTLLIVDYPEEFRDGAIELLRDLATMGDERRIRVLFLTRQKVEEWREAITDANAHDLVDWKPVTLRGIDPQSAHKLFCVAHEKAAELYDTHPLPLSEEALAEWLKQSPENDIALFVVALAVHGALHPQEEVVRYSGRKVVEALAERELERLERLTLAVGICNRFALGGLLAMAAIADGLTLEQLDELAGDAKLDLGLPNGRGLKAALRNSTMLVDDVIPAPKPDIVAAALLVKALELEVEKAPELVWTALELDIPGGLQRIARLCYDAEQTLGILEPRLSDWLAVAVQDAEARCEKLIPYFEEASLPRGWIRAAVVCWRQLRTSMTDDARLAMLLNNLSVHLGEAGESRAALAAIREGVELCRRLATSEPMRFEPDLAMSLNNLANRLSTVGETRAALEAIREAVEIHRRLATSEPMRFEPDLATSLNNFANRLNDFGKTRAALEAIREGVELYRRLAASEPMRFQPNLAGSLNNFANRLSEVGETRAALEAMREAMELCRRLAASEPMRFEPELAGSLNNLANRLNDFGNTRAALEAIREAVELYRRLGAAEPARFEPDLAVSLNNLAIGLGKVGETHAALEANGEAVQIHRRLAASEPLRFVPELAKSLGLTGRLMTINGNPSEAIALFDEAISLIEPFAIELPESPHARLRDAMLLHRQQAIELSEEQPRGE